MSKQQSGESGRQPGKTKTLRIRGLDDPEARWGLMIRLNDVLRKRIRSNPEMSADMARGVVEGVGAVYKELTHDLVPLIVAKDIHDTIRRRASRQGAGKSTGKEAESSF